MNWDEARAWLDAHVNLETGIGVPSGIDRRKHAPTLERIRSLLELLGSPELAFPAVHLTGTNGKTSVARMTSALLESTGLSTGSYTSPHLERVNERIAWNGEPIDDVSLAEALSRVGAVEDFVTDRPSYFEILTAAAFDWFSDVAVEVAVVEVGLGGTWDATNVLDGTVAVVTNVSIDHAEYLGNTRAEIAAEKAGIVKAGSRLVLGETDVALLPVFAARDPEVILLRGQDFGVRHPRLAHRGRVVDLYTAEAEYKDVFLPLHGAHQADNAAIALAAAESLLGAPLDPDGVASAFAAVRSPGRLEVVGHQPLILLDGAHNVAGAHALVSSLEEEFASSARTLVVGLLREKEPREMLDALGVRAANNLVCTRAPSGRALEPETIAAAARDLGVDPARVHVVDEVVAAVWRALELSENDDQVIVTGSLYVVGAARAVLAPRFADDRSSGGNVGGSARGAFRRGGS